MSEPRAPAWRVAMSLFTAIPAGVSGTLGDEVAARAILWLPAIGLLAGGAGAGVLLAAARCNATGPGRLLCMCRSRSFRTSRADQGWRRNSARQSGSLPRLLERFTEARGKLMA